MKLDALARNAGAHRDREVHVVDRRHVLLSDHRRNLGPLFSRELGARASLTHRRRGRGPALPLSIPVGAGTGLALSVLVRARARTLAAVGIVGRGAALAALSLHVLVLLAGLRRVLAHALRLILATLRTFVGALTLGRAGLLLGRVLVHLTARALVLHRTGGLILRGSAGLHRAGAASLTDGALLLAGFPSHRPAVLGGPAGVLRLLRTRAATAVAVHGTLCVRQSGAGNERQCRNRDHKAVQHRNSPHVFIASLPAPTTKGDLSCSGTSPVPRLLFVECPMNSSARSRRVYHNKKRPAFQPASSHE